MPLSEEAIAARREYYRRRRAVRSPQQIEADREYHSEWQRRNPDKVKLYQQRYWTKKGEEARAQSL